MKSTEKFQRIYEDDVCKQIWTYDYSITQSGPVSVETKWKLAEMNTKKKTIKDHIPKTKKKPSK